MTHQYFEDIVPSAVAHARERVALTREQLVEEVNRYLRRLRSDTISTGDVESWETGERGMTPHETYAFTKVTMFPYHALFDEQPPTEALADFRNAPGSQTPNLDYKTHKHLFQFNNFYELAKELDARIGAPEYTGIPIADGRTIARVASQMRDVLDVSEDVQSAWDGDKEAYEEWKRRIEMLGIFVISLPLNINQLRGASRWDQGGPPAVLISTADLPSARNFTLLHELAHLAHRQQQDALCDPVVAAHSTERRMNEIAAEALVPADWVKRETADAPKGIPFKAWPLGDRQRLRGTFNVSNQMLGIRLTELGITPSSGYANNGWSTGNAVFRGITGPRPTRAERYRRYLGRPLVDLLRRALDRNSVGPGEVLKHWIRDIKWDELWQVAGYETD